LGKKFKVKIILLISHGEHRGLRVILRILGRRILIDLPFR
jgi:hypothetical protein